MLVELCRFRINIVDSGNVYLQIVRNGYKRRRELAILDIRPGNVIACSVCVTCEKTITIYVIWVVSERRAECLLTYIKFIEGSSQFSNAGMAVLLISGRGGLSSAGNASYGLLNLLEHVVSVGTCGRHIWVAQEGLRGRVQHGGVFLKGPTCSCHLISTLRVFQFLRM